MLLYQTMTFSATAPFKKVSQGVELYPYKPLKFLKHVTNYLLLFKKKNLVTQGFVLEEPKIPPSSQILYQHVMRLVQDHGERDLYAIHCYPQTTFTLLLLILFLFLCYHQSNFSLKKIH